MEYYATCKECEASGSHRLVTDNEQAHGSEFAGLLTLQCKECPHKIYYCSLCYKAFKTWDTLRKHRKEGNDHKRKHIEEMERRKQKARTETVEAQVVQEGTAMQDNDDDGLLDFGQNEEEQQQEQLEDSDWLKRLANRVGGLGRPPTSIDDIMQAGFDKSSSSPSFFWAEHEKKGLGVKHLIAKAWDIADANEITDGEAKFALKFSSLLLKLTDDEMELLAYCMTEAVKSEQPKLSVFKKTRCPCTVDDFNKRYLDGKNAIIPNLPHPVINTTPDGTHAYTRLEDVIANLLAFDTPIDQFQCGATINISSESTEFSVSNSQAGFDLYWQLVSNDPSRNSNEFTLYLWIKEWRDDFDPFNTKKSRNQVWAHTYTICPPSTESRGANTFFMSISGKGDDHACVEKIFKEELEKLSTVGMVAYHGGIKQLINVKVGKLLNCVDRPERTAIYRVGDHNGTYSKAWGFAANIDPWCTDNHLPSCAKCRSLRVQQYFSGGSLAPANCLECSDWNITVTNSHIPKNYPTKMDMSLGAPEPPDGRELPDSDSNNEELEGCLPAVSLSVNWLKQAVKFAHHNYQTTNPEGRTRATKYWSKANLRAYLRTCAVSDTSLGEAIAQSATNGDSEPPIPSTWYPSDALKRSYWAPMHTLFLGNSKSNFNKCMDWFTKHKLGAKFGEIANVYLRGTQKLRVRKYFDAHPLSTSNWGTGVWVSENHSCFGRIMKFLFVNPSIMEKIKADVQVEKQYSCLLRFVMAANAAMSRVMSSKQNQSDMDEVIKLYLDAMVEMDCMKFGNKINYQRNLSTDDDNNDNSNAIHNNKASDPAKLNKKGNKFKKGPAFTKSTSLGMLTVKDQHDYFGPARYHWEGGFEGERKIGSAKQWMGIKRGNADWQRLATTKMYRLDCINMLYERTFGVEQSRELDGTLQVFRKEEDLTNAVTKCLPLSGILDTDGLLWLAHRPNDKTVEGKSAILLQSVVFDDEGGELVEGMCWIAPIAVNDATEKPRYDNRKHLSGIVQQYILFLPMMDNNGDYINKYYCIGSEWTERGADGRFTLPVLNEDIFRDWRDKAEPVAIPESDDEEDGSVESIIAEEDEEDDT